MSPFKSIFSAFNYIFYKIKKYEKKYMVKKLVAS
jgi:hypothetical protein